ncbi:MAG: HD domain-containing protein [Deltaproteobacteria bacterium]|nr:HD domain-containing protein [Deltaproteobacteria bacterium]
MAKLEFVKVIRDPIHGYIHLTNLELSIINTKIFSRLRNIQQSATAYLTYPSHTVNRYTHSLGVMEFASKMLQAAFESTPQDKLKKFRKAFSKEFKSAMPDVESMAFKIVRLAGLLHDIGHLPFSHLSEGAIKSREVEIYKKELAEWRDYTSYAKGGLHEFATYQIIKTNKEGS